MKTNQRSAAFFSLPIDQQIREALPIARRMAFTALLEFNAPGTLSHGDDDDIETHIRTLCGRDMPEWVTAGVEDDDTVYHARLQAFAEHLRAAYVLGIAAGVYLNPRAIDGGR